MRVYHREHAGRPIRAAWMLEELGEDYEIVRLTREQGRAPEHRARHPLGRVPVLEGDDGSLFESAAICLALADEHPASGLIGPLASRDRALAYQWCTFAPAELEPPLFEAAFRARDDAERAATALRKFNAAAGAVSAALGADEYLVADRFGVADVMVGTALAFALGARLSDGLEDNVHGYVARLRERPAYRRAAERIGG